MPNLKAIKQRIKSVQSTQKITRAMRLVAAAKVNRAKTRVLAARPFTQAVVKMLKDAVREISPVDVRALPLLDRREVKKVLLIVITSDRGLCGSYNTNILREASSRAMQLQKDGKAVALLLIGLKAVAYFKHIKIEKLHTHTLLPAVPTVQEAKLIAEEAAKLYVKKEVDSVEIIGTHFVNMIRSDVVKTKFLPVELPPASESTTIAPQKLFEPNVHDVMELELLPKYIENVIYQCLLEASASELAARMNAMTNASNNARDLISSLTLVYNKARQASITQELLEIVGGAEALQG